MSSKEASVTENKNALESRERPDGPSESTDDGSRASPDWGTDDARPRDGTRARLAHAGRRYLDWGDRHRRRLRRPRGDADRERGRDRGPPAAFPALGDATTYGDERRRGRRIRPETDDRRPPGPYRAVEVARGDRSPRADEFEPVRRRGPAERVRNARPRRATERRENAPSGRYDDGGRPDRACKRAVNRRGSDVGQTGQGRHTL